MEFLIPFGFKPISSLLDQYSESEVTKTLNLFPSLDLLNKTFSDWMGIDVIDYNRMKNAYNSLPPFVYYVNPEIKIEEYADKYLGYKRGYLMKEERGVSDRGLKKLCNVYIEYLYK